MRVALGTDDPGDAAILDLLQELAGQAVGALREKPAGQGLLFCVETPQRITEIPDETPTSYRLTLTPELSPAVAVWSTVVAPSAAAEAGRAVKGSAMPPAAPSARTAFTAVPANLDVILDIDLPLSVRFGQAELTLDALTRLGPGSVIDLGRSPDDPVDVLVNGRLVARAEVVVVDGNYGVRIIEVVSAADRVRSLGV
jgi:flagellar motor switch protein FliN/FliY